MDSNQKGLTAEFLNQHFLKDQMAGHLGLRFTEVVGHVISGELTVSAIHARPGGIMNGATSLFMIETLASIAGACTIDRSKEGVFGLEMNANHVKTVAMGDTIQGIASPIHLGRSTQIWEVKITRKEDLICIGRITLFVAQKSI